MKVFIYTNPHFISEKIHQFDRSVWIPKTSHIDFIIKEINSAFSSQNNQATFFLDAELTVADLDVDVQVVPHSNKGVLDFKNRIVFYTQSDTLSSSLIPIIKKLDESVAYKVLIPPIDREHAARPLEEHAIDYEHLTKRLFLDFNPTILFFLNDWSKLPRGLLSIARLNKISSICLQESIINFGDKQRRMEHSDYVMIQGLKTLWHLPQKDYFLTGNPRYQQREPGITNEGYYLVNCNFTYNIEETNRYLWLDRVIAALEHHQLDYRIVQHPRDQGDLTNYKNVLQSSSVVINDFLAKSVGVISRFSSLLHEAIVHRIPAIYFNPHKENLHYDFEADNDVLFYCEETEQLKKTLYHLKSIQIHPAQYEKYLIRHCINPELDTPATIAGLISKHYFRPKKATINDTFTAQRYAPAVRKIVDSIKDQFNL